MNDAKLYLHIWGVRISCSYERLHSVVDVSTYVVDVVDRTVPGDYI